MSVEKASLEQIQRWMQSVIMHPDGVKSALGAAEARRHLDLAVAGLEGVILPSRALDSQTRLEIYVDAYYERLLECLREEFPVTRHALGDELFSALAFGYLQHAPSRSYTLGALGANFPSYLADSRLHAGSAPEGTGESWADFVIELATLERSLRDVFDGPGSEDLAALSARELAALSSDAWHDLRFIAAPCLRLHRFDHPVHEFWAEVKDGRNPQAPGPRATWLAINRREYRVERSELSAAQFIVLDALCSGRSLREALSALGQSPSPHPLSLELELESWFFQWTRERFFSGLGTGNS
jgi:hypothetical protein